LMRELLLPYNKSDTQTEPKAQNSTILLSFIHSLTRKRVMPSNEKKDSLYRVTVSNDRKDTHTYTQTDGKGL
jgi:hypothetical protein